MNRTMLLGGECLGVFFCGSWLGLLDYVARFIVIIFTGLIAVVYIPVWGLISLGFYSVRREFPKFPIPQYPFLSATSCLSDDLASYFVEGWKGGKSKPLLLWNFLCDTAPGSRARWRILREGRPNDYFQDYLFYVVGLETMLEN